VTPRDFCYWLQGFFEINNPITIDPIELDIIKDHLKLVFRKETPDRSVVPFLDNEREVFDDNYVKEALGIDKEEFVPYEYPKAFTSGIMFSALSPEELKKLREDSGHTFVEYPLYPDSSFPTLFDMENNVPVSC
jgi:hypothetical protein